MKNLIIQPDPSAQLRVHTNARIGLGNVGGSLPTVEVLSLKLAHAEAKDAVFSLLNIAELNQLFERFKLPIFNLKSKISDRLEYLKRPDLGRRLDEKSVKILKDENESFDLVFVITDGLSAEAVNQHSLEILQQILPAFQAEYRIALVIVEQGRVAIADEIGELLNARLTAIFIGERPGLSSPKSMGIYITFQPKVGLTDEKRNCISNIHNEGLSYEISFQILLFYIEQSLLRKYSGVDFSLDLSECFGIKKIS
jgi:ethanolamine ammonia-lyase small subunit